jgi:flagellar biosynthesis protein FlhF
MHIRKFQAASVREALAEIKRALGPEAVVLGTREVRHGLFGAGVEVTAAVDADEAGAPAEPFATEGRRALGDADVERILLPIRSELRSLRSGLRALGESAGTGELLRELQALRRSLAAPRSAGAPPPLDDVARGVELCAPSRGRVVALVGPTGAGKTTTLAKLAARSALVERRRVGLITLDTFRVGGVEQIQAYAAMIGVPAVVAVDARDLQRGLDRLADRERIYIDTAGRSPRDVEATTELAAALEAVPGREVHLVLTAGATPEANDAIFARHQPLAVDRLLFTKIDEADDLEELVRAPSRLGRPVSHLSAGQRVPEDLEDATGARLLALASGSGMEAAA